MAPETEQAQEFVNTTQGWLTVIKINTRTGEHIGHLVAAGETVFLTEAEQRATADAPKRASDNPFLARPFKSFDPETHDVVEEGERPPLQVVSERREIPMRPIGTRASGEEVGVPGV